MKTESHGEYYDIRYPDALLYHKSVSNEDQLSVCLKSLPVN